MTFLTSFKMIAGAAALVVGTMGAASASTVTFDMGTVSQGSATDTVSSGGISVDITAAGGTEGLLTLFSNGALGVGDGATGPGTDIQDLMRGPETLTFAFTPAVRILQTIVFESGGGTDTVQILNVDSGSSASFVISDGGGGTSGVKDLTVDLAALVGFDNVGTTFQFSVLSSTGSNQGVAIQSVTVAAVPLPAGGLLLLAGLGGVAAMRRRRKAA